MDTEVNNKLGEYIKSRRKNMNLSLRDFGKICGISHTHIDSIEKGVDFRTGKPVRITNEVLAKLASALSVAPSYLLNLSLGNKPQAEPQYLFTDEEINFLREVSELSESEQKEVLDYIRFKKANKKDN